MTSPVVWFLVPTHEVTANSLPTEVRSYWEWIRSCKNIDSWGPYDWTLQTYLHLKDGPVPCRLTHSMPSEGIVIAHRDFFPDDFRPGPKLLLVCIVADRDQPGLTGRHKYAQLSLVQNPRDDMLADPDHIWEAAFMPFWLQAGQIVRNEARGSKFENIAYFGQPQNLVQRLHESEWVRKLADLGLRWRIVPRWQWDDYSEIDATVAVRSFAGRPFGYKPASKLFLAWRAGVPAVLGQESAYTAERRSELDYLEAATFEGALEALRRLRDDLPLRQAMVANGKQRIRDFLPERMIERWRVLLTETAVPAWIRWCERSESEREQFFELRDHMSKTRQEGL